MNLYTPEEFQEATNSGATPESDPRLMYTLTNGNLSKIFNFKFKRIQKYYYMVTFTLPFGHTFDEDVVESYIISQLHREPLQIIEAHIVKEFTKKGVAHWHCPIVTTKALKKDRFNYYIKKYGTIDISKSRAQNLEESLNYCSKITETEKIV